MVLGCLTRPPAHALACPAVHDSGNDCVRDVPQEAVEVPAHGIRVEVEDLDGDERGRSLSVNGLQLSHATVLRSELLQDILSLEGTTNLRVSASAFKAWHSFSQSAPYPPSSLAAVLQVCCPHTAASMARARLTFVTCMFRSVCTVVERNQAGGRCNAAAMRSLKFARCRQPLFDRPVAHHRAHTLPGNTDTVYHAHTQLLCLGEPGLAKSRGNH